MGNKKETVSIYQFLGIIVIPSSLFWILYRYGFLSIIDTLAVGILVAAGIIFGIVWLSKKKIIQFRK